MGHRGGNPSVPCGSNRSSLRQAWIVVSMDQIVGQTGMLRVLPKQRLENAGGAPLPGVGGIANLELADSDERQGVEYPGLVVLRVPPGHLLHRRLIGKQSGAMIGRIVAAIVGRDRSGVISLAGHRSGQVHRMLRRRESRRVSPSGSAGS